MARYRAPEHGIFRTGQEKSLKINLAPLEAKGKSRPFFGLSSTRDSPSAPGEAGWGFPSSAPSAQGSTMKTYNIVSKHVQRCGRCESLSETSAKRATSHMNRITGRRS